MTMKSDTNIKENPFIQSRKCMSLKFTKELCAMTTKNGVTFLKWWLQCQIYSTLSPFFMCQKYFDECFMDDLPHIALTKFNKLKKKEHLFNDSVYLCFIFSFHFQHIFRLSLAGRLIYTCFRTIFLTLSQKIVVNCMR